MKEKIVIIGSGPTGLGAAYRLKEKGINNFIVLEKSGFVGGLAASFKDEKGFTWDIGGHVQFSHYHYFDTLMEKLLGKDGWLNHERESWVYTDSRFIPYPFQNNIKYLDKEKMWECLQGIIHIIQKQSYLQKPNHFKDWILSTFGEGIAKWFMFPYNYKVWAYPPEQMSYQWVGERVAVTDLERVTKNVLFNLDDVSWGPNNTFQFPKKDGTGAIWEALSDQVGRDKILVNTPVINIDPIHKKIQLQDGKTIDYEVLLSTIPLDKFTSIVQGLDAKILTQASMLKHSTSHIIGVGLRGKPQTNLSKKCWMYFPEDNCPFYRVTVFSNYSSYNVPDINKYWSLMTETSESVEKKVDRGSIVKDTIQGLLNTKLIESADDIVSVWQYIAEYGYPTPSISRDEVLGSVIPVLDGMQLYSRGRFGGWKYEVSNQDHSLMQGVEWVNYIIDGIPEITYNYPNLANSNFGKK
jgi:protoporphyrinogen oxidase